MKKQDFKRNASSAARLAAVQGLYEIDVADAAVEDVVAAFKGDRWESIRAELKAELNETPEVLLNLPTPDRRILPAVIRGVSKNRTELDAAIVVHIGSSEAFDHLEALTKAILRAAVYELVHTPKVPIGVISSDYVAIANAFFTENQPNMINAVISALADQLRETGLPTDVSE
jgi:transcription antitermination protein NusB